MQNNIEIGLLALLLIILYVRDTVLNKLVNNKIGKILLLFILFYITKRFGITSGLIATAIALVLFIQEKNNINIFNAPDKLNNVPDNTVRHHYTVRDMENILNHTSEVNTLNASSEY